MRLPEVNEVMNVSIAKMTPLSQARLRSAAFHLTSWRAGNPQHTMKKATVARAECHRSMMYLPPRAYLLMRSYTQPRVSVALIQACSLRVTVPCQVARQIGNAKCMR